MKHTKINIGFVAFSIFALFAAFCVPVSASQAELYSMGGEECIFDGTFVLDGEYYDVYKYVDLKGIESVSVFSHSSGDLIEDKDTFLIIVSAYLIKGDHADWKYNYELAKLTFYDEMNSNDDEIEFFDDIGDINCRDIIINLRSTNKLLTEEVIHFEKIIRICNYIEDGGNDARKINELEECRLAIKKLETNRSEMYNGQDIAYKKAYNSIEEDYYYKDYVDTWRDDSANAIRYVLLDIGYLSYCDTVRLDENKKYISWMYNLAMYRQSEYELIAELENEKNESSPESTPFIGFIGASLILCVASKFKK